MQSNANKVALLLMILFITPLYGTFANKVPNSHERAIFKLLKSYEKELNELVPNLYREPNSSVGNEFAQLYFLTDSSSVINHITPENIKAPKEVLNLAESPVLRATQFLRLAAGLYKNEFEYLLDTEEIIIQALTDSEDEKRFVYQYRISLPAKIKGKINGQIVVDFKKDIDLFVLVYMDSKRSVKYAKIQAIQSQDGKSIPLVPNYENPEPTVYEPKKEDPKIVPSNNSNMLLWLPDKKQATVLEYAKRASFGATEAELEKMKRDFELLFDESGFVTVNTRDGQSLRMAKKAFLSRAAKNRGFYEIVSGTYAKFDDFRSNTRDSYFCRVTTIADAKRFENGIPVGTVSVGPRMPVTGSIPAQEFWKIIELVINEK